MRKIFAALLMLLFPLSFSLGAPLWEKEGDFYFLSKDPRSNFSAKGAGANKFPSKYLSYDNTGFLVRGAEGWRDYGRIDLEGNNMFSLPIRAGMKVEEVHLLSGGNFGNSYEHDELLRLYGDNYFYATLNIIFAYQDGSFRELSVPIFWDWFRLGQGEWQKEGASIRSLGPNPVRKDCSIFHIAFRNPKPSAPLKSVLLTDSWLSDLPFSEVFALTVRSSDAMEASPKEDRKYDVTVKDASKEQPDSSREWLFNNGLDGWVPGASLNWDSEAYWEAEGFGRKGIVAIPACNWGGDKISWIEKRITLPGWERIGLQFLRRSSSYSEPEKKWTDSLLKVIVKAKTGEETVYEKLYSGDWSPQTAELSRYKGQTVIIRFENHGAGAVRLSKTTSPACDGEDALIDEIRLIR